MALATHLKVRMVGSQPLPGKILVLSFLTELLQLLTQSVLTFNNYHALFLVLDALVPEI